MNAKTLSINPVHLGMGAIVKTQPDFTGSMDWYTHYAKRTMTDHAEGRLVSMHEFSEPWDVWEKDQKIKGSESLKDQKVRV